MTLNGSGSSLEIGRETTFGVPVTPTVSVPFNSQNIGSVPNYVQAEAIRHANSLVVFEDRAISGRTVGGDLQFPLYDKGLGLFFLATYGGTASYTFTPGAGSPNTHSFIIAPQGAPPDVSLYIDAFIGGQTNALCKEISGVIPDSYTISNAATEGTSPITVDFPVMAKDLVRNDSKTANGSLTPSPLEAFAWAGGDVTLGSVSCVQDWSLTVTIPKARRWCAGKETIDAIDRNGMSEVTGNLTLYFENWDEANAMDLGTVLPLTIEAAETGTATTNHKYTWTQNIQIVDNDNFGAVENYDRIEVTADFIAGSTTPGDNDLSGHTLVIENDDGDLTA